MSSVVTFMEFGVKPERENRPDLIIQFEELLSRLNFQLAIIDQEAATKSYKMRAKYKFLKEMDAMQIGSAIKENCSAFMVRILFCQLLFIYFFGKRYYAPVKRTT